MRLSKKLLKKLVKVDWYDSSFQRGWIYKNLNEEELDIITTVGFVRSIGNRVVEISSTIGKDNAVLNPLSIPIGAIISIKELG